MADFQEVLVSGPVSYSILSYKDEYNDLIVHNFGDRHVRHTQCEDGSKKLHEAMDDTFEYYRTHHPDEVIDVFFEYGAHFKKVNKEDESKLSFIHELMNHYIDCYQPPTDNRKSLFERTPSCNTKYPNVRFHLIDLRRIMRLNEQNANFFDKFIMNQFKSVKNPLIKNKLEEMYKKFGDLQDPYMMIVMDLYLLSRLFRPYVKKAIIYSGSSHSLMYDNFFESLKDAVPKAPSPSPSPYIFVKKCFDDEGDFLQCIFVPLKNNSFLFDREFLLKYEIDLGVKKPSTIEIKESINLPLIQLNDYIPFFNRQLEKTLFKSRQKNTRKSRQKNTRKSRQQKTRKSRQQKTLKSRQQKTLKSRQQKTLKSRQQKTRKSRQQKTRKSRQRVHSPI